jgi:hypothetical protein
VLKFSRPWEFVCLAWREVEARFRKESVQIAFVMDTSAQVHLAPGAVAMVPVRASRLYSGELQVQDAPGSPVSLAAQGPVTGTESMLFSTNRSDFDVKLEMGMTVAVGQYEAEPLIVNSDQVPKLAKSVNYGKGEV